MWWYRLRFAAFLVSLKDGLAALTFEKNRKSKNDIMILKKTFISWKVSGGSVAPDGAVYDLIEKMGEVFKIR